MNFNMGTPEWLAVALKFSGLLVRTLNAKTMKTSYELLGYSVGSVISPILWIVILYWGGFFA